jgi:hypothetical protein
VPLPKALYSHIPEAYQISVEISPRHPAQGNNYYLGTQFLRNSTTQGVLSRTFIHCSIRRLVSKFRATIVGSIRSSHRSSIPPRLVSAASDTGAERIGFASWISGDLMTTFMLASGSASSCTSSVGSGATGTPGSVVAPSSTAAPGAVPSTGTALGIVVPSTCVSVITSHTTSVLRATTTT